MDFISKEQAARLAHAYANYCVIRVSDLDSADECTHVIDTICFLIDTQVQLGIEIVGEQRLVDRCRDVERLAKNLTLAIGITYSQGISPTRKRTWTKQSQSP